jgi:hypothetical protein
MKPTIHERAYQLTAEFTAVADIRKQLIREGYDFVDSQLSPRTFRLELRRLCGQTALGQPSPGISATTAKFSFAERKRHRLAAGKRQVELQSRLGEGE